MVSYPDPSPGHRPLADYPRPSVAVDTALLTVPDTGPLSVVLVRSGDSWRLPGTFLHEGENLADAVIRSLADKAGVSGVEPRQLRVFDDPGRDDRGWVLSVAHLDAVPSVQLDLDPARARFVAVAALPALPWDHPAIVAAAVAELRQEYAAAPDPRGFLPGPFTLRALRSVHEAVAGAPLPRDTFRRAMEPHLVDTGVMATGTVGKPARLFQRS